MSNWFYFFALAVTVLFVICFITIFISSIKIEFTLEKTLLKIKKGKK